MFISLTILLIKPFLYDILKYMFRQISCRYLDSNVKCSHSQWFWHHSSLVSAHRHLDRCLVPDLVPGLLPRCWRLKSMRQSWASEMEVKARMGELLTWINETESSSSSSTRLITSLRKHRQNQIVTTGNDESIQMKSSFM